MQSRRASMIEAVVNTVIGFVFSFIIQIIVFHAYGVKTSVSTDLQIVFWFTIASILRGYWVRRMFNWWHTKFD